MHLAKKPPPVLQDFLLVHAQEAYKGTPLFSLQFQKILNFMTLKQQDVPNVATPTRSSGGGTARKVVCLMAASVYAVGHKWKCTQVWVGDLA